MMANTIRCISKFNFNILNKMIKQQLIYNGNRTLYNESSLGLDNYKSTRKIVFEKYKVGLESFKNKMHDSISDDTSMIFTEDLKSTLHLIDKDPNDIQLIVKMIQKYQSQNSEIRFGTFKFGPVVMRAFHYLNEPEVALELFLDSKYDDFFNQMSTYMVLLDLLYENKKYVEVRTAYDKIKLKFIGGINHPKLLFNILAMSCYKENTSESLQYGLQICKDLNNRGNIPLRKVLAALGALALNLKLPHITLELTALSRTTEYISIRCLRIMALAELNRIDDIVMELNTIIKRGYPEKNHFYPDTITKIEEVIRRLNISEDEEICSLIKFLQSHRYIMPMTIDEHLSMPIITSTKENLPTTNKFKSSSWSESAEEIKYDMENARRTFDEKVWLSNNSSN